MKQLKITPPYFKMTKIARRYLLLAFLVISCTHFFFISEPRVDVVNRRLFYDVDQFLDEEYFTEQKLRVVSFGTSRAWGSGLRSPVDESYTSLLNGTNLAIRSSNSDYPAMCAYSMLGEEIYDVIIIEYMPETYGRESLLELGRRLRRRFPDAMIIYLNIWSNHQFFLKDRTTSVKRGLYQVVLDKAAEEEQPRTLGTLERVVNTSVNEDWDFNSYNEDKLRKDITDPEINGVILNYDLPDKNNYLDSILKAASNFYLDDMTHFSKFGHQWIKHEITKILRSTDHKRSDMVNPWVTKDHCLSWFQTGKTDLGTNMHMVSFSNGTKFALEASNSGLNVIQLVNDGGTALHLYLSHMSTGPDNIYGDATIEICQDGVNGMYPISNTTITTHETWSAWPVHVMNHKYVGMIPEGKAFINVKSNLTKDAREYFRTTGIIITPKRFGTDKLDAHL